MLARISTLFLLAAVAFQSTAIIGQTAKPPSTSLKTETDSSKPKEKDTSPVASKKAALKSEEKRAVDLLVSTLDQGDLIGNPVDRSQIWYRPQF